MKTTSKRILSMLLVFVMVFSLLPGYALAADEQPVIDFDPFAELENEAAADESLAAAGGEGAEAPEEEIIEEEIVEEDMILGEEEIVTMAAISGLSDSTIGLNGGTNYWSASGNTINGSVTGYKLGSLYFDASDTLTITNNKDSAATLSFDFTASGNFAVGSSVTIDGTEYTAATTSSFSKELAAGGSITIKLAADRCYASNGANTISIAISNLSLVLADAGTITTTFEAAEYGSYTVSYGDTTKTVDGTNAPLEIDNDASVQYTMSITPTSGYKFVGWKNVTNDVYLSYETSYSAQFDTPCTIKPIVVSDDTAVFKVADSFFTDLDDAVNYATENSHTQITLVSSGEISDPSYTIPEGMTLLIPMDENYTPMGSAPEYSEGAETPVPYLTLTLAAGTGIDVNGTVELEAKHACLDGAGTIRPYGGRPAGSYGAIYMNDGSNMTFNSGAVLYAWGYVYGSGTVTVNSGAKVYEYMQCNDFPGGSNLSMFVDTAEDTDADGDGNAANDYIKSFPLSQYYIQNVEVPMTLAYGAEEYLYATVRVSSSYIGMPVEFIGDEGMFALSAGATLTKDYDEATDRLIVDVNGDATLSKLVLDFSGHTLAWVIGEILGTTQFDSSRYILGLNSNITLNVNSGMTTVAQDVALFPGVEVYVDNGATLYIKGSEYNNITVYGSGGHNVYVYDLDQWGARVFQSQQLMPATYSPTAGRYQRTADDLKDVIIDVNGTIIADGFLYTTVTVDDDFVPVGGGASIISSGTTGKIVMNNGAGIEEFAYALDGTSAVDDAVTIASAWLKNGDGTYLETAGAEAGTTYNYCAIHDKWYTGECDECAAPVYEITWVGATGDLGTEEYSEDVVPTYKGDTPTKAQSGCTVYTFAGWKANDGTEYPTGTALPAATTDATYYAYFTESESHAWTVTYNFAKDGSSCTATRTCGNDASHNVTATATITGAEKTAATCTEKGWTTYIANFDEDWAETQTKEVQDIPATDHAWTVTYSFAEDGKSCTATRACANDASHNATATATITGAVKTAATCEGMGTTTYTATFAEDWAETQTKEVQDIPATDHAWTVTYNFAEDGSNCTATRTCGNDASHVETADATITSAVKTPATCEGMGTTTYTATFTEDWAETQTKDVEDIAATDHDWGEPTFKWTKLYTEATATRTCKNDSRHVETEVVTATAEITTDPTCYAKGKTTYTATFTKDWTNGYVMTMVLQDVDNAGIKHNYQPTGYKWDVNNQACTVYVECVNDGCSATSSHLVYSTISTVPGTCKTPAETTYTAVFPEWTHGVTQTTSVTGETDPNNHESTEVTYKSISDTQHEVHYECCDALKATEGHTYVNGKCVCTKVQTFTVTWVVDGKTVKTETVEYGENATAPEVEAREGHSFAWDNDGKAIKSTTTIIGTYTANSYNYTINTYTMGIDGKYGEPVTETKAAVYGSTVSVYPEAKTGFTVDGDSVTSATIGTGENVLSVYYIRNQYSVKYMVDGAEYKTETYYYEAPVTALAALTKEGHTFSGWSAIPASMPAWDVTVTGSFTVNSYTITYMVDGEQYTEQSYTYGAAVTAPEYTVPEGYTFSGWNVPETMPAENVTLDASLTINSYTVTFTVNGEQYGEPVSYTYGAAVSAPEYTVPEGYTFSGWNVPVAMPAENITLDASLTINSYTVTFTVNGEQYTEQSYTYGAAVSAPEYTVPEGYTFSGWNVPETMPAEDITLDASLTANSYTVTFTVNGEQYTEQSYTYGAAVSAPEYTVPEGYTFSGWEVPETMPAKDITIDASLTVNSYTLTIKDWESERIEIAKLTVPYGANLLEYLENVEVENIYKDGYVNKFSDEWWYYVSTDESDPVGESTTMPAENFTVFALFSSTGWMLYADGYRYVIDDCTQHTGWTLIKEADYTENGTGSAWYYLDTETGLRAEGVSRVPYPTVAINGLSYTPDQESIDYAASKGQSFIDAETGLFIFGTDGKFQSGTTGIGAYLNATRYAQNGHIAWHPGMVEAEGSYYYFIGDSEVGGNKLATGDVYVSRNTTEREFVKGGVYTFGADGKLCDYDGITEMADGKLRYYENAQLMLGAGLVEVEGKYIHVRSTGELVVNAEYWVAKDNDYGLDYGMYYFDENGFMVIPEVTLKEGVYYENGGWYFYENGVKAYNAGLVLYAGFWYNEDGSVANEDSVWIYVRSNGQLATGTYYVTNIGNDEAPVSKGEKCEFGEYGELLMGKDGIVNGYYYENNHIVYNAGLIEYGGGYIYVRSNGQAVKAQTYWITNTNDLMNAGFYEFGEDYLMVVDADKNGIVEENGTLYYYLNGVKQMGSGLVELDDGYIYVRTNGALAVGVYWITNVNDTGIAAGKYTFGSDGFMVK